MKACTGHVRAYRFRPGYSSPFLSQSLQVQYDNESYFVTGGSVLLGSARAFLAAILKLVVT